LKAQAKEAEARAKEAGDKAAENKNSNRKEWSKQIENQERHAARAAEKHNEANRLKTENDAMRARIKRIEILPCFSADTLVWTSPGGRRIDSLNTGDAILAFDFDANRIVERTVIEVFRNRTAHFHEIAAGGQIICATGAHRFFVSDSNAWVAARDLRP